MNIVYFTLPARILDENSLNISQMSTTIHVKIDRRVTRTRQGLREALLQLMDEKEFSAITVEEITDRANLGRTTFYLHYRDKEDLLLEEVADLIHKLTHQVASVPIAEWQQQQTPQRPILLLFQHVKANARFYRLLLRGEDMLQATERLGNIIITAVNELAGIKGEVQSLLENSRVPISFLGYYFTGALFATIIWWLEQDLASSPEEIAALFQEMILPGMKKVVL